MYHVASLKKRHLCLPSQVPHRTDVAWRDCWRGWCDGLGLVACHGPVCWAVVACPTFVAEVSPLFFLWCHTGSPAAENLQQLRSNGHGRCGWHFNINVWIRHLVHVVFWHSKSICFPVSQGSSGHSLMSAPLAQLANMFRTPGNSRAMHNSMACSHIFVRKGWFCKSNFDWFWSCNNICNSSVCANWHLCLTAIRILEHTLKRGTDVFEVSFAPFRHFFCANRGWQTATDGLRDYL